MDNQETKEIIKELTAEDLDLGKFIQAYIEEGNATKAYMKLHPGMDYGSAATMGCRMLKKVNMADLMEGLGITDQALAKTVATGIVKPEKCEQRIVIKQRADGSKYKALEWQNVPDYAIRHKFTETALRLKKRLTGTTGEGNVTNNQFNGEVKVSIVNYADKKDETPV